MIREKRTEDEKGVPKEMEEIKTEKSLCLEEGKEGLFLLTKKNSYKRRKARTSSEIALDFSRRGRGFL